MTAPLDTVIVGGGQAGLALGHHLGRAGRRFAIVDRSVPSLPGINTILDELIAALAHRETVYVHCWGGRGRTGTVVGCYLRRARGLAGLETLGVLAELTQHDPKAFWPEPEMDCQRKFIEQWRNEP